MDFGEIGYFKKINFGEIGEMTWVIYMVGII